MKNKLVAVPKTMVQNRNKFCANILGLLNQKATKLTPIQAYEIVNTYRYIVDQEKVFATELIFSVDIFNKLFGFVKEAEGWADLEGMAEMYQAFNDAKDLE